jgi:hypothetical protein
VRAFFAGATTTDGFSENATDIIYPTAGTNWPTVVALAVMDSATQGQGSMIWWGGLNTVGVSLVNQRFRVATGDLDVTLD